MGLPAVAERPRLVLRDGLPPSGEAAAGADSPRDRARRPARPLGDIDSTDERPPPSWSPLPRGKSMAALAVGRQSGGVACGEAGQAGGAGCSDVPEAQPRTNQVSLEFRTRAVREGAVRVAP